MSIYLLGTFLRIHASLVHVSGFHVSAPCSHDASEEVGTACKTECTTTTIMMPSCAKKLQANPLIPVGEIQFLLFVTAVNTLWEGQVSILRACKWM